MIRGMTSRRARRRSLLAGAFVLARRVRSPSRARRCRRRRAADRRTAAPSTITGEARAAASRYAPGVTPGRPRLDRWRRSPRSRPEAAALIAEVDGLVDGPPAGRRAAPAARSASPRGGPGASPSTSTSRGSTTTSRWSATRPSLHELGHVVDFALVDDGAARPARRAASRAAARAASPSTATSRRSASPTRSRSGRCAARSRSARATASPMPASIEGWGEPLGALERLRCRSSASRRCATRRRSGS